MLNVIKSWIRRVFASSASSPANWFVDWVRGTTSDSGIAFTEDTALRFPPIWYAVNKIGGHVGVMPLVLYQRNDGRARERATLHPSYRIMKSRPNHWMSAHVFKETVTAHALLWGNGRAAIMRDGNGQPLSLEIMDPAKTKCVQIHNTELRVTEKWHVFRDSETHEETAWPDRDVLHIQGLGSRGFEGYSVIDLAKNSWGLGLAAEKAANRLYRNDAVPPLILEAPPGVFRDEADARQFLDKFNTYHAGTENKGKAGLLREGITAKPLSMSSKDAEFVNQRVFQRQEAALWMLLEQIMGDDKSVSYNSLEQKNLAYLTNCLLRWLVKWEEECNAKLLTTTQRRMDTHFFKFTTAALLRGTTKERYEVYQIGRQIEVLSANDVREMEDMNPREGGDLYANPAINPQDSLTDNSDTFQRAATRLVSYEANQDRLQLVTERQIRDLIHVEVRQIRHAAEKRANFLDWMDSFYNGFERRCVNIFERCGGTSQMAEEYIAQSRELLLDSAGTATPDELADAIKHDTAAWGDRTKEWANRILGVTESIT